MRYIADLMINKSFIAKYVFEITDDAMLIEVGEFEKSFGKKYNYKNVKLLMILPYDSD